LAITGHGFGGTTALSSASKDKRIKACFTQDAWLAPYEKNLDEMLVQGTPLLFTIGSDYYTIDNQKVFNAQFYSNKYFKMVKETGNNDIEIPVIEDSTHMTFTDQSVILGFE
jgi:hypothetical protein